MEVLCEVNEVAGNLRKFLLKFCPLWSVRPLDVGMSRFVWVRILA